MDVLLKLDDETMTLISILMEIGVAVSEQFNEEDHKVWGTSTQLIKKAEKIRQELDEAVVYDYLIQSMGEAKEYDRI